MNDDKKMKKGNKLTSSTVPVAELRQLFAAVSNHGTQHLLEVEADLNQTTFLLSGAIEKLSVSFMSIHDAITTQQKAIDALVTTVDIPQEAYQEIVTLREKISTEIDAAVTGLQFQDMTSQLIARAIKHVDGLRISLEALSVHGQGMDPAHEHQEIVNWLNDMNASLNVRNDALLGGLAKSVSQKNMNSGEIDLF